MFEGSDFTFVGGPIDDVELLEQLPAEYANLLRTHNGFVCYRGGLHVRGAVQSPPWHSLRAAWHGDLSLHCRYASIQPADVPFGEDCVGDQFLLRGGVVVRLSAETGEVEDTGLTFDPFLAACDADPVGFLLMQPLLQLEAEGGALQPGQLINVYPPYCAKESAAGVSVRAISASEVLEVHATFARTIGSLPDGARVGIRVE